MIWNPRVDFLSTDGAPMPAAALDIGYSNLKVASGRPGSDPRVVIRPAGAAPADRLGERLREGHTDHPAEPIFIDIQGRRWAAGIEPARLDGWARSLHEDYTTTESYLALVRAGLVLTGERYLDTVVTGLPVGQANDPRRSEALRQLILGAHPTGVGVIEVAKVRVVPQPVGAYLDLVWSATDPLMLDRIETGAVLVLDAGFYSFDWALVVAGELRRSASGTSLEAMSVLLDRAARHLGADLRRQADAARLGGRRSRRAQDLAASRPHGDLGRGVATGRPARSPRSPWRPCGNRCGARRPTWTWCCSPAGAASSTARRSAACSRARTW